MNYKDLQNTAICLIKSNSLKNMIKKTNKIFEPIELVKIVFNYSESYEQRLNLLSLIEANINDDSLKKYIMHIINTQREILDKFLEQEEKCVYELHINETPDSYEERYLCNSYMDAKNMIALFYQEYGGRESKLSKYKIEKRKIFKGKEKFEEDYLGHCILNFKREICKVEIDNVNSYANICDGRCGDECKMLCINNVYIDFPCFLKDMDIVDYVDYNGKSHYGVYLENMSNIKEEYYIIPLDCMAMRYYIFERDFYNHEHIEAPFVEKAELDNIPDDIKNIYKAYIDYHTNLLKKN